MQLLSGNYASNKLLSANRPERRSRPYQFGMGSVSVRNSANQIISFHFALAIYDEFDANAIMATNAVSLSMCYCKLILATVCHNYSDKLYWYNRNRRLGAQSGRHYCQLEAINRGALTALIWFALNRPKPTANVSHSCRQVSRHDTLSAIFKKFCVPKSVSARRLLGLDRFT